MIKLEADVIQAEIKSCLKDHLTKEANPDVWTLSKKITSIFSSNLRENLKIQKNEIELERTVKAEGASYPDDFVVFTPEQRSEEVAKLLDYKLKTKELSASELRELKDIFNLKAKDQDIHIEQVDFRDVEPELADIVAAVEWQINDYNKET